jgi:aromatic-L-amino-acid decarboxylase
VAADERFELLAPHPLALVTFAMREGDQATRELLQAVNASGEVYLTHTVVNGRYAIRLAIGSVQTERRHVEAAWQLLSSLAAHSPIRIGE